jgi:hypothetical protein
LRDTLERRIARIAAAYAAQPRAELIEALERLAPRVGRPVADRAQAALLDGNVTRAVAALLPYYDGAYAHQLAACPGRALAIIDIAHRSFAEVAAKCSRCAHSR